MIDVIKTSFDVSLDEPFHTLPGMEDVLQGCVASASRSESVRGRAELRLVVCLQNGAHDFLQQFVRPSRDAERSCFSIPFRNLDATNGGPSEPFNSEQSDNFPDLPLRHSVHGFRCRTFGHGSFIAIEAAIGSQVEI